VLAVEEPWVIAELLAIRPGRGMRCREDVNAAVSVEVFPLAFGLRSPEAEDSVWTLLGDEYERLVCELRPPTSRAVRHRLAGAYGQDAVQKEDALLSPGGQIATHRRWDPDVVLECGVDVAKTLRKLLASTDREGQACRSPVRVRILADDDDLDLVEWCQLERLEDVLMWCWIEGPVGIQFLGQKRVELPDEIVGIGLAERRVERSPTAAEIPVLREAKGHSADDSRIAELS